MVFIQIKERHLLHYSLVQDISGLPFNGLINLALRGTAIWQLSGSCGDALRSTRLLLLILFCIVRKLPLPAGLHGKENAISIRNHLFCQ